MGADSEWPVGPESPEAPAVPASPYDPDDSRAPDAPDGYRDPVAFSYSLPAIVAIAAVLLGAGWFGFGGLLWAIQAPGILDSLFEIREDATSVTFVLRTGTLAAFVATVALVTAAHELVHGLVYRRYGYRVRYGVAPHLGAFYAGVFHQFQTRQDTLHVLVAPLVLLDAVLLPLLFVPLVAFGAFVGLLFNTAGAAGDAYALVTILRMPPGTLLYHSDIRHSYAFYPLDET